MVDMATPSEDIKNMTVPWLFQDLRKGQKTGTVVFEQDDTVKKVFFIKGDVLFASSNRKEDRLGEFLLRTGKMSGDQFEACSAEAVKTGKKLGAVLCETGALTAKDLVEQVKLQVKEIILSLFSWRRGQCRFDEGPLPEAELIPLHMSSGSLILEGVRNADWQDIRKSLPSLRTVLRPTGDPLLLFQDADLDPDCRSVLAFIDGEKSIEEICSLTGLGDFNTLKSVYVLLALRIVEQGTVKSEAEMKSVRGLSRKPAAGSAGPGKRETAQQALAVSKEALLKAHAALERQNLYEVLGIGSDATAKEVRKAYLELAKRYHPDQHFRPDMSDMKERLEALFHAIHEAYVTLSDETGRGRYDSNLARGKNRRSAEPVAAEKPDNKDTAVAQFEEGKKRFNVGNYWGAEEALQWAVRLDPGNADYVFHLGRALSRMPRRGHDAEENYVRAIELASKTEYYLELGDFYVRHGLKTKALSLYRDALKRAPDSEKILQAIRKAGG
jgi:tetratricopeptide (TPR) repeat protein